MSGYSADWRTCPQCGVAPLEVRALERIEGSAAITLHRDEPTGLLVGADFRGDTEVDWDSSTTVCYQTACCDHELPEDWQERLDQALDNRRLKETR